jgi:LmbE family N-acetylglucosaminyl deacetylase
VLNLGIGEAGTVLCLGAHPDDIEVGCGGTLMQWLSERPSMRVHWVVLSGTGVRRDEAVAGARAVCGDAASVVVKDYRDSFFPYQGADIKDYFHELAGTVAPDVIFTHREDDGHQDHRLVSALTRCAFRDHMILEYEIPKYDGDLGRPNVYVPLDEAVGRRKVRTILETFESQRDRAWFTEETFLATLRLRGVECNARYAEGFHCRKMTL